MCVIVYKPRKVSLPGDSVLRRCWDCNPDGAGIAWIERGHIEVRKGLMEYRELIEFLGSKDWTSLPLVLHFRLASKGAQTPLMTHPFSIGERNRLSYRTKNLTLFHNGTLIGFGDERISDTCDFVHWLGQLRALGAPERALIEIVKRVGYIDKFLVLTSRKIYMIGTWFELDGCFYSNLYWHDDSHWRLGRRKKGDDLMLSAWEKALTYDGVIVSGVETDIKKVYD